MKKIKTFIQNWLYKQKYRKLLKQALKDYSQCLVEKWNIDRICDYRMDYGLCYYLKQNKQGMPYEILDPYLDKIMELIDPQLFIAPHGDDVGYSHEYRFQPRIDLINKLLKQL